MDLKGNFHDPEDWQGKNLKSGGFFFEQFFLAFTWEKVEKPLMNFEFDFENFRDQFWPDSSKKNPPPVF